MATWASLALVSLLIAMTAVILLAILQPAQQFLQQLPF
jgi:hypothetical protein